MPYSHRIVLAVVLFIVTFGSVFITKSVFAQFVPPENITLSMYRLEEDSGDIIIPPTLCVQGDQTYGCTGAPGNFNYDYPFLASTIVISIDGAGGIDNSVYEYAYLWDVVTVELGVHTEGDSSMPNNGRVPLSAIGAQAIAARTFAYHRGTYVGTIDNSSTYHVFLPFRVPTTSFSHTVMLLC